jgi:septum formation protein
MRESGVRVILASGSPRRRELLAGLGLPYEVAAADVDETPWAGELPGDLVVRLARAKAVAVASRAPDAVVVAADTTVTRGRRVYEKPVEPERARRMLAELVGRGHRVMTGVAVASGDRLESGAAISQVWLRPWSAEEIDAYVASGDPLDKAGAYAIQNERFRPVARLRGCRCNVVGLPLGLVAELLARIGIEVPATLAEACPYASYSRTRCGGG